MARSLSALIVPLALAASLSAQTPSPQQPAIATARAVDPYAALDALPPAVRVTVESEIRGATLKGVSEERMNGSTVYELESIVAGRTRDVMIDAAGRVYLIEEEVSVASVPAPVRSAFAARGGIVKLEAVTTRGKTYYEGHLQTRAGKRISVDVGPDGKPIQ